MRIAISGTHVTGKSTLGEALSEELPQYAAVEEPYYQLEEDGHEFSLHPSLEDFELQLERSIENLEEAATNIIFDRCPADILAYLLTHEDADAFNIDGWLARIQRAVATLDLVVFVPIEEPDRIVLPVSQGTAYRQRVDEKLQEIVLDNIFHFDVDVLEVSGSPQARAERVLTYLRSKGD
jgi:hypothetical protein